MKLNGKTIKGRLTWAKFVDSGVLVQNPFTLEPGGIGPKTRNKYEFTADSMSQAEHDLVDAYAVSFPKRIFTLTYPESGNRWYLVDGFSSNAAGYYITKEDVTLPHFLVY